MADPDATDFCGGVYLSRNLGTFASVNTIIRIVADVGVHAGEMAKNQALAQGFRHVQVFQVRQVGPREFDVELICSK